ncbi:MAG TPA: sugar ABC transporter permease [Vicinamibacterales bacterium]
MTRLQAGRASGWLWGLPAALLIGIVLLYPAMRSVVLSLTHQNLGTGFAMAFAGTDNFVRLAADSRFHASVAVTTLFVAASVALEFLLGLVLALATSQMLGAQSVVRTLLLIPWTLPTAIVGVLWTWILNDQFGIVNHVLIQTGLLAAPVAWLAHPSTALASMIAADVWKTVPFVFLILLAGLQSVPADLYEALAMDGAGPVAAFRYVTWPHLVPFAFIALIFRIVQAFAVFDLVYVLTGGGPGGTTETVSLYAYQTTMRYLDFSYGSTIAVALVFMLAVAAFVLKRVLREPA